MPAPLPPPSWRRELLLAAALCGLILVLCYTMRGTSTASAQIDGTLRLDITKTLEGSDLVRLGQPLTFTIRITNTGTISVVKLPLFDQYDRTILEAVQTEPPPTTLDAGAGTVTWDDLIPLLPSLGGALKPGESIVVTTRFRTIRANVATVNRARIGDAVGAGGQSRGGKNEASDGTRGGRVIVDKRPAPGSAPEVGKPITFTIALKNDGAADITRLPLQDSYASEYLQFASAVPPPTGTNTTTGSLNWDDVLPAFGLTRLRPNETLTVTAVFTALKTVDGQVLNRADARGVRDEYGNELPAPRRAEIPIRIIGAAGQKTPTATPRLRRSRATATPTAPAETPTAVVTPTANMTPTAVLTPTSTITPTESISPTLVPARPSGLPRTGGALPNWLLAVALALLCCGGALALRAGQRR